MAAKKSRRVSMSVPKAPRTSVPEDAAQRFEVGETAMAPSRPQIEEAPSARDFAVTTVRLTRAQHSALRKAALELAETQGGKADASAVLRLLLDEWLAEGAPLPQRS